MGQRRAVGIAHRNRSDQKSIENGSAGEREAVAADNAGLLGLAERRGEPRNLRGFLAEVSGNGAGERVQQYIFAVILNRRGEILVAQSGGKLRQNSGRFSRHSSLPHVPVGKPEPRAAE